MRTVSPPPLVCGGSPDHARRQRITGWMFIAVAPVLGLVLATLTLALGYLEWELHRPGDHQPGSTR